MGVLREEAERYRGEFGHDIPPRVLAQRLAEALQGQGEDGAYDVLQTARELDLSRGSHSPANTCMLPPMFQPDEFSSSCCFVLMWL